MEPRGRSTVLQIKRTIPFLPLLPLFFHPFGWHSFNKGRGSIRKRGEGGREGGREGVSREHGEPETIFSLVSSPPTYCLLVGARNASRVVEQPSLFARDSSRSKAAPEMKTLSLSLSLYFSLSLFRAKFLLNFKRCALCVPSCVPEADDVYL